MEDQAAVCAKERCKENCPPRIQTPTAAGRSAWISHGASACCHLWGGLVLCECVWWFGIYDLWLVGQMKYAWFGVVLVQYEYSFMWQLVCAAQVLVVVLSNGLNHEDWPRVVSDDIHRHLEKLRSRVVTLRGRAEGRTLLPLPLCVERARPQDIALRSVHG